jgi:error-prone DNA polymerase
MGGYVELQATSHFSFLRGASSPEELHATAALLGLPALAVVDRNSVAGIVRARRGEKATTEKNMAARAIVGCRLDLACGTSLLVYPQDRDAYSRLTRLLSLGKARAIGLAPDKKRLHPKGSCILRWEDVTAWSEGLVALLVADAADDLHADRLCRLHDLFGDRGYAALSLRRRPGDGLRLLALTRMATAAGVATVATGDILYATPDRRMLQDVVTCIREKCTIDQLGYRRERFADRHLKPAQEMERLFARYLGDTRPVARSVEVAERCRFSLDQLTYQYPEEARPGETPQQTLVKRVEAALVERYPDGPPVEIRDQIDIELRIIAQLDYASYFITVSRIVDAAREKSILCQGRGSAANSAVCFVLGVTSIDPCEGNLLFERFISVERNEPPDIDIDFEHERREEVIQWIYGFYGRQKAALTATVIRYRSRGAVREVGKALGLSEDVTGGLANLVWGWSREGVTPEHARALNLDLSDHRLMMTLDLARQLIDTPRHLSQHPGGFVLTRDRLDDLVPIEPAAMADRQVIEWDKDDIDELKFMKVDILGLGMLGCMRRSFDLLREYKEIDIGLYSIPDGDEATYDMICEADTLGVFQIESRAQMTMLPRLKPRKLYDLTIEVAIVRPGPIQGDMVHPYLRRRDGLEKEEYPDERLKGVLGKTLGVPLFQEQAMQVAMVCANFTGGQADELRRSMATFKVTGGVHKFHDQMIDGMIANGYSQAFAEKTFKQIEGFGSYGFPESHAASFARIAYISSWMKCHHPDVFCAALLNAQPMGFYAPAQIVRDAREHGIEVRPVCVQASRWDCTLEPTGKRHLAVRLGLRMAKGLAEDHAARLILARAEEAFESIEALWRRAGVPVAALERIAEADGYAGLGLARREALWAIRGLSDTPLPLFAAADARDEKLRAELDEPEVAMPAMRGGGEVVEDYRTVSLSLRAHPLAFLRRDLASEGVRPCGDLATMRDRHAVRVSGLILVRQKPGSAKGVMFITLEDESGIANVVVWPNLFERYRRIILTATMLLVKGRVQREGAVIHVVAEEIADRSSLLRAVAGRDVAGAFRTGRGDGARHGGGPDRGEKEGDLVRPRDIYAPDQASHVGNNPIRVKTRDFR